jgi:hypothetical protein
MYRYAAQGLSNADCPGCGRKKKDFTGFFGGGGGAGRNAYELLILPVYGCPYGSLQNSGPYNETVLKVILILGMDLHIFKNLSRNRCCLAHRAGAHAKNILIYVRS